MIYKKIKRMFNKGFQILHSKISKVSVSNVYDLNTGEIAQKGQTGSSLIGSVVEPMPL